MIAIRKTHSNPYWLVKSDWSGTHLHLRGTSDGVIGLRLTFPSITTSNFLFDWIGSDTVVAGHLGQRPGQLERTAGGHVFDGTKPRRTLNPFYNARNIRLRKRSELTQRRLVRVHLVTCRSAVPNIIAL
jgi:hypothetical protein